MKPEVKQRIEQIQQRKIPEGYRRGKLGIVPLEWKDISFSSLLISTSDYTGNLNDYPLYSLTIEDGVVPKTERYERSHLVKKEDSYKVVRPDDFVYNPMNLRFGAIARYKGKCPIAVSGYYDVFTTVYKSDLPFMDSFLTCGPMLTYYNRVSTGSLVEKQRVHFSQFLNFSLPLPPLEEREKVAEILMTQDRLIALKKRYLAEKEKQKKYLMQVLLTGKKRLPGFKESWKWFQLKELLHERKLYAEKDQGYPHVTLGVNGIFPKGERYNRDHLVKSEDKEYKVTRLGDICYNPANLKFGVICENTYGDAIFSPIYVTFEVKSGVCREFLSEYLVRWDFINAVRKYEEGTVYERMAVKPEDFLKYEMLLPPYKEQKAIVKILMEADKEINLLKQELEQERQKKKALMQLLLSGIVRTV